MKYKMVVLDRDGVINKKAPEHQYIKSVKEFCFLDGSLKGISILSKMNCYIVIVTNQRGIARRKFSLNDLYQIHIYMKKEIERNKGRVDKIYFCPHENNSCECRKPKPGMILNALKEFNVNPCEVVLLGDSFSDYQTAKNVGCDFIHIASSEINQELFSNISEKPESFDSLLAACIYLSKNY
jgi:D-glycero-D-manno-heptose 1,7-bisphosphate phosphatase